MATDQRRADNAATTWTSTQAYGMAVICLLLGVALGYLVRGSGGVQPQSSAAPPPATRPGGQVQVTAAQIKQMADSQAAPLLQRLRNTPNDAALLAELGNIYYDAQSYQEAVQYYDRSLAISPSNANVRTDLATVWYYLGDADRAVREFETVLKTQPDKANTLFNLGMVKWRGKMDASGAVAAWEKLLATNPNYEQKDKVQQLIAKAKQHGTINPSQKADKASKL
jgi:cytochrome c-type biogenesis protein CcmH/NrfG